MNKSPQRITLFPSSSQRIKMYNLIIGYNERYMRYYIYILQNKKVLISYQFDASRKDFRIDIIKGKILTYPFEEELRKHGWRFLLTIMVTKINGKLFSKLSEIGFAFVLKKALSKLASENLNYLNPVKKRI